VNVEGRKITVQQTVAETFNEYFVALTEYVKRQSTNTLINDDKNSVDYLPHFREQAFNKPYPNIESKCTTTKKLNKL
jgi:hypothetical protein